MLGLLYREGDLTARVIAERLAITERSVRRILKDLETEGYIQHRRVGRKNAYRINLEQALRRADQSGVTVGALLKVIGSPAETQPMRTKPKS
ncbi:MAG: winged helix-turn-helix domain-containing protein [Anaerolineales bacterium]